jgi:hypothetical protein
MIKKLVIAAVAAVSVIGAPAVSGGGPANAAEGSSAPCCSPVVTKAEFNSVRKGMTVKKVIDRFDSHGQFVSRGYGYMTRRWNRTWHKKVVVEVTFRWNTQRDAWVLTYKWAGKPYGE